MYALQVFLGPAGTVTRLHGDTYFTHAWLSQIRGSKQFVLYPPSQHHLLHATATANAGADSAFDPLAPDYGRFPRARGATPHVAVCGPGDTILVGTILVGTNLVGTVLVHRGRTLPARPWAQPSPWPPLGP